MHTHKRQRTKEQKKKEKILLLFIDCSDVVHKVAADKIKSMPFD